MLFLTRSSTPWFSTSFGESFRPTLPPSSFLPSFGSSSSFVRSFDASLFTPSFPLRVMFSTRFTSLNFACLSFGGDLLEDINLVYISSDPLPPSHSYLLSRFARRRNTFTDSLFLPSFLFHLHLFVLRSPPSPISQRCRNTVSPTTSEDRESRERRTCFPFFGISPCWFSFRGSSHLSSLFSSRLLPFHASVLHPSRLHRFPPSLSLVLLCMMFPTRFTSLNSHAFPFEGRSA